MIAKNEALPMPIDAVDQHIEQLEVQFLPEPADKLGQRRTLTEVEHLYDAMNAKGVVPQAVLQDIRLNLQTFVSEMAMPYAVTTTVHRVQKRFNELTNKNEQFITWMGKSAVENALNGRLFHVHDAALQRVDVEVAEARHAEATIRKGKAQIFISPKMSAFDAPRDIAEQEHLADDDSIRVSKAITNKSDEVTARQLQSLLVRDIPLASWYAWLKSDTNLFGRAFEFVDERSALPIMKLFAELEVDEAAVPEGPVSIIADVVPFLKDPQVKTNVEMQLAKFSNDQASYEAQAQDTAERWLAFDVELARSLQQEHATFQIQAFIITMQNKWNKKDLKTITAHQLPNAQFRMTRDLAELLERANQNILANEAAIATGNEKVLRQLDTSTAARIKQDIQTIRVMRQTGASATDIAVRNSLLSQTIASQNLKVGGGCAGSSEGDFSSGENAIQKIANKILGIANKGLSKLEEKVGKLKKGKCVVKSCPSRPGEVTIGGCGVCIDRCQKMFDKGHDPTKINKQENKDSFTFGKAIGSLLNKHSDKKIAPLQRQKTEINPQNESVHA